MRSPCPELAEPRRVGHPARRRRRATTVCEARSPIFSSRRPTVRPGVPASTRKAVMPCGARRPVRAQTTITPATSPLVIQAFSPVSTQRVAAPLGAGGERGRVAAAARLGEREGPGQPLGRGQPRHVALPLGRGAVAGDELGHHVGDPGHHRHRAVHRRELDERERVGRRPGLRAAQRRRHVDGQEAELAERRGRAPPGSARPGRSRPPAARSRSRAKARAVAWTAASTSLSSKSTEAGPGSALQDAPRR